MFKKILLLMVAVLFSVNGSVFAQAAASSMTIVDLPATGTDAAIGINSDKTYTHTFDFGESDEATINGVFADSIQIDIDIDDIASPSAHYLDYTFVADDNDVILKFAFKDFNQGPHIYGLTCEIVPETGVDSKTSAKPSTFGLMQNYPNPFNPQTTIDYQLPAKTYVSLKVFDITGHEVTTLVNGEQAQGHYSVKFDGHHLSSGIYFYQLKTNEQIMNKRMLLLK